MIFGIVRRPERGENQGTAGTHESCGLRAAHVEILFLAEEKLVVTFLKECEGGVGGAWADLSTP